MLFAAQQICHEFQMRSYLLELGREFYLHLLLQESFPFKSEELLQCELEDL